MKYPMLDSEKPPQKLKDREYKQRKADAYARGWAGAQYKAEFVFEREYWEKGRADNAALKGGAA